MARFSTSLRFFETFCSNRLVQDLKTLPSSFFSKLNCLTAPLPPTSLRVSSDPLEVLWCVKLIVSRSATDNLLTEPTNFQFLLKHRYLRDSSANIVNLPAKSIDLTVRFSVTKKKSKQNVSINPISNYTVTPVESARDLQ